MTYRIEFEKRAIRQYKKLDRQVRERIANKVNTLGENPHKYPLLYRYPCRIEENSCANPRRGVQDHLHPRRENEGG